jgi:hypothetical protein
VAGLVHRDGDGRGGAAADTHDSCAQDQRLTAGWWQIGIRPELAFVFSRQRGLWAAWAGVLRRGGDGIGVVEAAMLWQS